MEFAYRFYVTDTEGRTQTCILASSGVVFQMVFCSNHARHFYLLQCHLWYHWSIITWFGVWLASVSYIVSYLPPQVLRLHSVVLLAGGIWCITAINFLKRHNALDSGSQITAWELDLTFGWILPSVSSALHSKHCISPCTQICIIQRSGQLCLWCSDPAGSAPGCP